MRRKDRAVLDRETIDQYIRQADVCRVGFAVDQVPYIVPMNYGYDGQHFYFHCAKEGRKIEMLQANPNVCFEIEAAKELITGEQPCDWSMRYISVMGTGTLTIVTDTEEKKEGLNYIMRLYGATGELEYTPKYVDAIYILKLSIETVTCKKARYD